MFITNAVPAAPTDAMLLWNMTSRRTPPAIDWEREMASARECVREWIAEFKEWRYERRLKKLKASVQKDLEEKAKRIIGAHKVYVFPSVRGM